MSDSVDAAREIGELATRILDLAPTAGLYVGIEIKVAADKVWLPNDVAEILDRVATPAQPSDKDRTGRVQPLLGECGDN